MTVSDCLHCVPAALGIAARAAPGTPALDDPVAVLVGCAAAAGLAVSGNLNVDVSV